MAAAAPHLDHRGYSDLASLLRGDFDAGALRQELSGELPPKPQVIWDVQTGHRRLRPAPEPPAAPPPRDPKAPTPQTPPVPEESVGAPGYKQGLKGAAVRARRPGEFHAAFRRMPTPQGPARQNEVMAAVQSIAGEHQALIDDIMEQCDKVSRMILLATANALRESNDQSEKPMPWMTAKAHIKKELGQLAGLEEVHRLLDVDELEHVSENGILLYKSPEERNAKAEMEDLFVGSIKKFQKNERVCDFDMERVQKRMNLHSKDAEGVLNYAGQEDNGRAVAKWFKSSEAIAVGALESYEAQQRKIFEAFAKSLRDMTELTTQCSSVTPFTESGVSFHEAPQVEGSEKDLSSQLEVQKKMKEKAVWELKRQLDELIAKRKRMDDTTAVVSSGRAEQPKGSDQRLQHAKSLKEMDKALEQLEQERQVSRKMMESAGPQLARMVDFMSTGQKNLRRLLDELKAIETKQEEVELQLQDLVAPESKQLIHEMIRNKEIAVELLDATILPISKSDPQDVVEAENLSEVIAEAKEVSNQQLVAAARRRQQLRLEKEALEAEILERQQAAIAKAQQRQAEIALQESSKVSAGLAKELKSLALEGNMLLSDLRTEQKDKELEVLSDVLQVMEDLKEALLKTTKLLAAPEVDTANAITEDFQDVEIAVRGLKMSSSRGFKEEGRIALKRSTHHVTEELVQESAKENEALERLNSELEGNRLALAQVERRLQRMRVALRHAEPEPRGEPRGVVEILEEDLEDLASLGSEFDSDAEDLAPRSTLVLPRKSAFVAGKEKEKEASEATAVSPPPAAAVQPVAKVKRRRKERQELAEAKKVHEALQAELGQLREELKALAAREAAASSAAQAETQASETEKEEPEAPESSATAASGAPRLAELVRSHSGKLLQGLHGSGSGMGLALLGNSKALQSQKRELQQMVKQLKTEVQKKLKLLMSMVPKENHQDLINAGVFPGEGKIKEGDTVDDQVASLKSKLETLRKSVVFWQTRLETHIKKFNAMVEAADVDRDESTVESPVDRESPEVPSAPTSPASPVSGLGDPQRPSNAVRNPPALRRGRPKPAAKPPFGVAEAVASEQQPFVQPNMEVKREQPGPGSGAGRASQLVQPQGIAAEQPSAQPKEVKREMLQGLPGAPLQGVAEQPSAQSKAEVKREMPAGPASPGRGARSQGRPPQQELVIQPAADAKREVPGPPNSGPGRAQLPGAEQPSVQVKAEVKREMPPGPPGFGRREAAQGVKPEQLLFVQSKGEVKRELPGPPSAAKPPNVMPGKAASKESVAFPLPPMGLRVQTGKEQPLPETKPEPAAAELIKKRHFQLAKRGERRQEEVHRQLQELVAPESQQLIRDKIRNKAVETEILERRAAIAKGQKRRAEIAAQAAQADGPSGPDKGALALGGLAKELRSILLESKGSWEEKRHEAKEESEDVEREGSEVDSEAEDSLLRSTSKLSQRSLVQAKVAEPGLPPAPAALRGVQAAPAKKVRKVRQEPVEEKRNMKVEHMLEWLKDLAAQEAQESSATEASETEKEQKAPKTTSSPKASDSPRRQAEMRRHSAKLLQGLQSSDSDQSMALGNSSKGLQSQKRKLQQLVKRLKTQAPTKSKFGRAEGQSPKDQRTLLTQVQDQGDRPRRTSTLPVSSLSRRRSKLDTLRDSVSFWQSQLEKDLLADDVLTPRSAVSGVSQRSETVPARNLSGLRLGRPKPAVSPFQMPTEAVAPEQPEQPQQPVEQPKAKVKLEPHRGPSKPKPATVLKNRLVLGAEWVALPAAPVRPRPVPLREPIRVEQPELQPETKPEPLPEKKAPAAPADIIKKLPLLPPKKMAEIPLEEASVRLRLNLMLFHRGKGDSPIVSPRHKVPEAKLPEVAKLPQFSSLKGGFSPKMELTPRKKRPSPDEVNQKARELLRYLQGSDARPERLQPEASKVVEPLPPVERTVSAQAAGWAEFLEERLGRHVRAMKNKTQTVRGRDLRSLLFD